MTGTIAYDQTQPAVAARRTVLLSFTPDDLKLVLADRMTALLGFTPESVDAKVKIRGELLIDVEFDVPAATRAPLPSFPRIDFPGPAPASAPPPAPPSQFLWYEFPGPAPASAPPPAPPSQFLWYEFQATNPEQSGMRFAWGHGRNKAEAHADACVRREGEPGEVTHHTCRTLVEPPCNVPELYYEFAARGRTFTFVGKGCTERQGWEDVMSREPQLALAVPRCVGVSRNPITPAEAPACSI